MSAATWCPIDAYFDGITTRGVLLDVAAGRPEGYVTVGKPVTPRELDAVAARAGVKVEPGDVVVVRNGDEAFRKAHPDWVPRVSPHPGMHISCLEWFREKARALAVERQPPPPLLQGRHVLALGLPPGPEVGRIVRAVYERQLDGARRSQDEAHRRRREPGELSHTSNDGGQDPGARQGEDESTPTRHRTERSPPHIPGSRSGEGERCVPGPISQAAQESLPQHVGRGARVEHRVHHRLLHA